MSESGNGNTIAAVFKAILASPVGGWALAVCLIGFMAYLTFKDREAMYRDVIHLRHTAMPLIEENNQILKEIRGMVRIPSDNRNTLREIRDMLKGENHYVPTISNDQP